MGQVFDLGTVLSITSERLLTNIGNVYNILNFMTGDNLYTHQLPRASEQCAPSILALYPELIILGRKAANEVHVDNWEVWLANAIENHGNEFEIEKLLSYTPREPFSELIEMMGGVDETTDDLPSQNMPM